MNDSPKFVITQMFSKQTSHTRYPRSGHDLLGVSFVVKAPYLKIIVREFVNTATTLSCKNRKFLLRKRKQKYKISFSSFDWDNSPFY
jgi:hypothetical protein